MIGKQVLQLLNGSCVISGGRVHRLKHVIETNLVRLSSSLYKPFTLMYSAIIDHSDKTSYY